MINKREYSVNILFIWWNIHLCSHDLIFEWNKELTG